MISELSHREIDVALGFPTRQGLGFLFGARDAKIELARSLLALPVA